MCAAIVPQLFVMIFAMALAMVVHVKAFQYCELILLDNYYLAYTK